MSRDRRCGHHAEETPLHACTAVRVPNITRPESKECFHSHINTQTIFKFPDRLVAGSGSAILCICASAELQFTRNPAIDVAADCPAAPRRNVEDDTAAPWQRASPRDHVQVAAVRAAWHES